MVGAKTPLPLLGRGVSHHQAMAVVHKAIVMSMELAYYCCNKRTLIGSACGCNYKEAFIDESERHSNQRCYFGVGR